MFRKSRSLGCRLLGYRKIFLPTAYSLIRYSLFSLLLSGTIQAETVVLSWNPNTESNIAGYKVYQRTGPAYDTITTTPTANLTLTNITPGTVYYFAVAAYDTSGQVGALSQELSYQSNAGSPTISGVVTTSISDTAATIQWTTNTARDSQ